VADLFLLQNIIIRFIYCHPSSAAVVP